MLDFSLIKVTRGHSSYELHRGSLVSGFNNRTKESVSTGQPTGNRVSMGTTADIEIKSNC